MRNYHNKANHLFRFFGMMAIILTLCVSTCFMDVTYADTAQSITAKDTVIDIHGEIARRYSGDVTCSNRTDDNYPGWGVYVCWDPIPGAEGYEIEYSLEWASYDWYDESSDVSYSWGDTVNNTVYNNFLDVYWIPVGTDYTPNGIKAKVRPYSVDDYGTYIYGDWSESKYISLVGMGMKAWPEDVINNYYDSINNPSYSQPDITNVHIEVNPIYALMQQGLNFPTDSKFFCGCPGYLAYVSWDDYSGADGYTAEYKMDEDSTNKYAQCVTVGEWSTVSTGVDDLLISGNSLNVEWIPYWMNNFQGGVTVNIYPNDSYGYSSGEESGYIYLPLEGPHKYANYWTQEEKDQFSDKDNMFINTALDAGEDAGLANAIISYSTTNNSIKGSVFRKLRLKQSKANKTSITVSWSAVKSTKNYSDIEKTMYGDLNKVKKYVVYAGLTGESNKFKKVGTTDKTKFTIKNLKKGTYYKIIVVAVDRDDDVISTSKTIHIKTAGGNTVNPDKISTRANTVTLRAKKTYKLKGSAVSSKKRGIRKVLSVRYESSKTKIATVSSKGVIKAKNKGTCYIYAYAQNGIYKKIKVRVK